MNVTKSEKAFRTITEAAEILKLPAHVLRFWESKFKYIKPMKRGGGRRYYRPEDINLLLGIKHLLYSEGLTIKGAQKTIQSRGVKSIIRLGTEKVNHTKNDSMWPKKQNFDLKKPVLIRSLDLSSMKVPEDIDLNSLKNILESLKQIHSRIKARCEKMEVR